MTEPSEWKDCPGHSNDKWHVFSMLLMGFEYLFVDSGSGLEFHSEFFFIARDGEGLACGSDGRRWRGSLGALALDFYVILSFVRGALFKGMDVKIL